MITALWRQRVGSSPVAKVEPIYDDAKYGYDERLLGYDQPPRHDPLLLDAIESVCGRADPTVVTRALARLRAGSIQRQTAGADLEAWLEVAGEELEEFPSDVVREACRRALRWHKWLPSVHELILLCEDLARPRRKMLAAARAAARR